MSEELQRYQKRRGKRITYEGEQLGRYFHYYLGNTTLDQLKRSNIIDGFTTNIPFKPRVWNGKPSKTSRPDELVLDGGNVILVVERKESHELKTPRQEEGAAEQCLVYLQQLNGKLGVITDYKKFLWIHNVGDLANEVHYIYEDDHLIAHDYRKGGVIEYVLKNLDSKTDSLVKEEAVDPSALADSVWQTIWHATHEEPKHCLATFVELFLYKFLSDLDLLPTDYKMESLNIDERSFAQKKGKTQIEFYKQTIRPYMKSLFPEQRQIKYPLDNVLPGSDITSIIDGFVFLEPGMTNHNHPLSTFNHSFLNIVKAFVDFGKIRRIDSEFKSRVYEKFLKKNVKQQKLGQYLTPRNVVRAILRMANPKSLMRQKGCSICDPASGVGGFLLEGLLHEDLIKGNLIPNGDALNWKVELIGLEVDRQTNILEKANMLIHLAEDYISLTSAQKKFFSKLMNQSFILADHDKMLGSLEFPQDERFDLILTNPPYVVKGTGIFKEKIKQTASLKQRYEGAGTGVESLFLRWIIDAIKPGGRAFVIIPTGILTRSETSVRSYIRKHCFLDTIIRLPERTFYNTPNVTYILCFTKKMSEKEEQKESVFAYYVREVGETRDSLRFKCHSDLPDLIRQFRTFYADKIVFEPRNLNAKLIDIKEFVPKSRWDIDRFWTEDERLKLGISGTEVLEAIDIDEFESRLTSTMDSIKVELETLREWEMTVPNYSEISLSNEEYFGLIRGKRITRKDIYEHPGEIPVVSGHSEAQSYLGYVSESWLKDKNIPVCEVPMITVNANGSVGGTFLRNEKKYTVHDDVTVIKVKGEKLYLPYVVHAIREAIAKAKFRYDAKLYLKRLRPLKIRVPADGDGIIDFETQKTLATQYDKLAELKKSVLHFAQELKKKTIVSNIRHPTRKTGGK